MWKGEMKQAMMAKMTAAAFLAALCACAPGEEATTELAANEAAEEAAAPAGPPAVDIYLAELTFADNGEIGLSNVRNVTDHPGYDNQPFFIPGEDSFLYARQSEGGRADIWRYDIASDARAQITDTPDAGEYSPKLTPNAGALSYLYEEEVGGRQFVYRAARDGSGAAPVLDLTPVGYYAWSGDERRLAMFVLGEPATLRLAELETGAVEIVRENIGRAVYALPDGSAALFTTPRDAGEAADEAAPEGFRLWRLEFTTGEIAPLFDLPGAAQDYAVLPAAGPGGAIGFFAAAGDELFIRMQSDSEWRRAADLSALGIEGATRLAVSPDRRFLAIVAAD